MKNMILMIGLVKYFSIFFNFRSIKINRKIDVVLFTWKNVEFTGRSMKRFYLRLNLVRSLKKNSHYITTSFSELKICSRFKIKIFNLEYVKNLSPSYSKK